jgi:hypothetical protein
MVRTTTGWVEGENAQTIRRREAAARNAGTPFERTAKFRRDRAVVQAAVLDAKRRRHLSGKKEPA